MLRGPVKLTGPLIVSEGGGYMDLLLKCARVFKHLLGYQYHFVLGRKGVKREILLGFNETDFHHLVGIHKLRDLQIARGNRKKVFNDILSGLR